MSTPLAAAELQLNKLRAFRQAAYGLLTSARDALFELADAVLLTPAAHSFVELSCAPVFRRHWPSIYAALQDGRLDRAALLQLVVAQLPGGEQPVLAGDHTAWPRPSARTLAERTFEHQPTPIQGQQPITIGQGYSTLVWVADQPGSWAVPLLHERITPASSPLLLAAEQLRRVTAALPARPLTLWDAEYGCAPFLTATADIPADKLIRLRPNLCLWGAPAPYRGRGRPAQHGAKFKLGDATTWAAPTATWTGDDADLGPVTVQQWDALHFQKAPSSAFSVLRVERLGRGLPRCARRVLWLAWVGASPADVASTWRAYLRRFGVDHWYRFAKQRLHWTLPQVSTAAQMERWSDLLVLVSAQVWLAREVAADCPLPWQKRQARLTPGRVCAGFGSLLALIGTPAQAPKRRGKAVGWPVGRVRKRRPRQEVVRKRPKRKQKGRTVPT